MSKTFTFCLCLLSTSVLIAQSPGGVSSNLKLWIKANSGTSTTTNGSPISTWNYANNGNSFTGTGTERPVYSASSINFGPAVAFSGAQLMDGPTGVNAPIAAHQDNYAVFGVWQNTSTTAPFQRIWSQRHFAPPGADGVSLWVWASNGTYGDQAELSPFTQPNQPYSVNTWYVSQLNLLNAASNDCEEIDQTNLSTSPTVVTYGNASRDLSDVVNRLGSRDNSSDEPFTGNLAELIVYDVDISGASRNQIFSYLAMKYGITLKTNLVNSAATTVWNAVANSTYNNSVFGLGRDDNSGLSVSQSNSIETGSGNGLGQSGKGNIVLSSPTSLDNNDFLIVGNDNGALTEGTTNLPPAAAGSKRLARQWKVQHTGNVGTMLLSMDFTGLTVTGTTVNDFRLMVDQDGDGNFATGTIRYYTPATYSGGIASFPGVTLNNNEVFAFITSASPATLPVTWTDFTVRLNNSDASLNWSVENNAQADHYEIEHSSDGINYSRIGSVRNVPGVKSYSFVHRGLLTGRHYYRIKEIDIDGRSIYSTTISVNVKSSDMVIYILQNPVKTDLQLVINTQMQNKATLEIWSASGTKILSQQQAINAGINNINLPMGKAAPGNYILKVIVDSQVQSLQFVKF